MRKLLFLAILICSLPSWATWTLTQVKSNNVCSGTTCAVTVASTGTGHLLVAGILNATNAVTTISGVAAGACSVAWVHCANCAINSTGGAIDFSYCTSSVAAQTSITITTSASMGGNSIGIIWEANSSLGNIAIDSGATPSGTKSDATCTACAGVSLTLSGSNNFIAAIATGTGTMSGLVGTGFTNDLTNPNGDGVAHGITSGSVVAPTSWTMTSGTAIANAIAFKESAGGVTCTNSIALMGVGCR